MFSNINSKCRLNCIKTHLESRECLIPWIGWSDLSGTLASLKEFQECSVGREEEACRPYDSSYCDTRQWEEGTSWWENNCLKGRPWIKPTDMAYQISERHSQCTTKYTLLIIWNAWYLRKKKHTSSESVIWLTVHNHTAGMNFVSKTWVLFKFCTSCSIILKSLGCLNGFKSM